MTEKKRKQAYTQLPEEKTLNELKKCVSSFFPSLEEDEEEEAEGAGDRNPLLSRFSSSFYLCK